MDEVKLHPILTELLTRLCRYPAHSRVGANETRIRSVTELAG
jgi:hypothetical protein